MRARRITIFAKGNLDVRDALHACREGGMVAWNGINAALREHHPGWSARLIHETMTRSDALLANPRDTPEAARAFPLGAWPIAAQFGTALFDTPADAVILSLQPDVMTRIVRHRGDGHLLYPHGMERWPEEPRRRLRESYAPLAPLTPEESMTNLARIVARLPGAPQVLICNLSAHVPGERVHSYAGLSETLSERIRRFNLALIGLSRATGAAIVDVDALLARSGAAALKLDALHLLCAGARLVAEEVVRILDERGCFAAGETAPCG